MEEYDKKSILEKIKNNECLQILWKEWKCLTADDLLSKDETNTSYFEYLCRNKVLFHYDLDDSCLKGLKVNKEALLISLKYEHIKWISKFENEDIFFEPIIDGKNFIEYALENNMNWFGKSDFKKRIEIIDYFYKFDASSIYLLTTELISKLFEKVDGKYYYDKYKDDINVHIKVINKASFESIYNYCVDTNNYDLLKFCNEEVLLTNVENDKTLLEMMLDMNIVPVYSIKEDKTLKIFVEKNRLDLLSKASLYDLSNKYDDNNTYLDLMLKEQKNGKEMYLETKDFGYYKDKSVDDIVKILLIYLKNNMIGYIIEKLNDKLDVLMYKGKEDKSVLEVLLDFDRDLIMTNIVNKLKIKKNAEFFIFLKSLGIDDKVLKIETDTKYFKDEYVKDSSAVYDKGYESEYEDLLIELRDLFYNDGESEKELVDALITSYRYLTSVNNEFGIIELKNLIEIKKKEPKEFTYVSTNDGAYYSNKKVHLSDLTIGTINHETSHALHYFLADEYIPEEYEDVVERARNNPQFIDRIKEFTAFFKTIESTIKENVVASKVDEYVGSKYTGDKLDELNKFLISTKEEQKEKLKDTYPEDVLDILLEKTYSVDSFIEQRKKIEERELMVAILFNDYSEYASISDIIDAIVRGKGMNDVIIDEKGENIGLSAGHGIGYYTSRNGEKGFFEMIANYGEIMKSKNAEKMIEYLRYIVGDEVVDMIDNCYRNKMLGSTRYINVEENSYAK